MPACLASKAQHEAKLDPFFSFLTPSFFFLLLVFALFFSQKQSKRLEWIRNVVMCGLAARLGAVVVTVLGFGQLIFDQALFQHTSGEIESQYKKNLYDYIPSFHFYDPRCTAFSRQVRRRGRSQDAHASERCQSQGRRTAGL